MSSNTNNTVEFCWVEKDTCKSCNESVGEKNICDRCNECCDPSRPSRCCECEDEEEIDPTCDYCEKTESECGEWNGETGCCCECEEKENMDICGESGGEISGYEGCKISLPTEDANMLGNTSFCITCYEKYESKYYESDEEDEVDKLDMKILGFKTTKRLNEDWNSLLFEIRNHDFNVEEIETECMTPHRSIGDYELLKCCDKDMWILHNEKKDEIVAEFDDKGLALMAFAEITKPDIKT